MKKRVASFLLIACMVLAMFPTTMLGANTCVDYTGTNVEGQRYEKWANPVDSYLTVNADGSLMSVKYVSEYGGNGAVVAEYFDASYNLQDSKIIEMDATSPIFGGFYATGSNYFVLTGQTNAEESAEVEVYRITKYDKNWNKIASAGLKDANTTVPFDAGSARMAACGKYLLIRTSHEMYKSNDGYNHQANVTIQLDMDTMTITDSFTGVMNNSYGYVSHSFNQFIKIEDNKIVAVDHGDAYPRSIVLTKYQTDVTTGEFFPSSDSTCVNIDVLTFPGEIGENVTGASVGGFEISDSTYLIAGNSVIQDESNIGRSTRNIFVASVDKETSEVTINWITNYEEGKGSVSTPQFVQIADNSYMLLWSRSGNVYYTKIDASGQRVGEVYSTKGALSDCVPVVNNGQLIWYTWEDGITTFYDIDLSDNAIEVTPVEIGHQWNHMGVTNGVASLECLTCGESKEVDVVTSFGAYWNDKGLPGYFYSQPSTYNKEVGDVVYLMFSNMTPSDANTEMTIEVSNPDMVSMEVLDGWTPTVRKITMLEAGEVTFTIYPKYNPNLAKSYTFNASTTDEEFKINSVALALENDITVIFKALATYESTYSNMYVKLVQEKENGETETQYIQGVKNGSYYEFAYTGVNAKEIADNLDATIYGYDANGNLVTGKTVNDYSVKKYCMNQLSKVDGLSYSDEKKAAFKTLLVDMLNYGAVAQDHFDYKEDPEMLANAALTEEQKAYASADSVLDQLSNITNAKYVEIANPSATWKSVGLNLLSKTNLRVKFAYAGDISEVSMVVSVNGVQTAVITEFTPAEDANMYYAFFDGFAAYQFEKPVDFTLKADDTVISNTLRYSVESYVENKQNDATYGSIVSALMKYGKAAEAFKNAQ